MRDIKFRAWNEVEEKMLNWNEFLDTNMKNTFIAPESTGLILMQYTGLKDKNGKEIYEGDIVRCKQYIGGNFVEHCIEKGFIEFRNGEFGLHRKQGYYQSLSKFIEYAYEFEVIGNIYDNPELLEEGD